MLRYICAALLLLSSICLSVSPAMAEEFKLFRKKEGKSDLWKIAEEIKKNTIIQSSDTRQWNVYLYSIETNIKHPLLIFVERIRKKGALTSEFGPGNLEKLRFKANPLDTYKAINSSSIIDKQVDYLRKKYDFMSLTLISESSVHPLRGLAVCKDNICSPEKFVNLQKEIGALVSLTISNDRVGENPPSSIEIEIANRKSGKIDSNEYFLAISANCDARNFLVEPTKVKKGRVTLNAANWGKRVCLYVSRFKEDFKSKAIYCRNIRTDWNIQLILDDLNRITSRCNPPKVEFKIALIIQDVDETQIFPVEGKKLDIGAQLGMMKQNGYPLLFNELKLHSQTFKLNQNLIDVFSKIPNTVSAKHHTTVNQNFDVEAKSLSATLRQNFFWFENFTLKTVKAGQIDAHLDCSPKLTVLDINGHEQVIKMTAKIESDVYVQLPDTQKQYLLYSNSLRSKLDLGEDAACRVNGQQTIDVNIRNVQIGRLEIELDSSSRILTVLLTAHKPRLDEVGISTTVISDVQNVALNKLISFVKEQKYDSLFIAGVQGLTDQRFKRLIEAKDKVAVENALNSKDFASAVIHDFDKLNNKNEGSAETLRFNDSFVDQLRKILSTKETDLLPTIDILWISLGENTGKSESNGCTLFRAKSEAQTLQTSLGESKLRILFVSIGRDKILNLGQDKLLAECEIHESWRKSGIKALLLRAKALNTHESRNSGFDEVFNEASTFFKMGVGQ